MIFDWDTNKAAENERKHGVTFEEAESVFGDVNAVELFNAAHSTQELRFQILGASAKRLLFVVHTVR